MVFSLPSVSPFVLWVAVFVFNFKLLVRQQEAIGGASARLLAALQDFMVAGRRALCSEVTSRLRVLAIEALQDAPELLAPLQAVGWDAHHRQFTGPLHQEALASLEAAVSCLLAAESADSAADAQVF